MEHLKTPSPHYDHFNTTVHQTNVDKLSIVGREAHNLTRSIKETIFARVNDSSVNRGHGKYNLPHI